MAKQYGFFATPAAGFFGSLFGAALTPAVGEAVNPLWFALKGFWWGLAVGLAFDLLRCTYWSYNGPK